MLNYMDEMLNYMAVCIICYYTYIKKAVYIIMQKAYSSLQT